VRGSGVEVSGQSENGVTINSPFAYRTATVAVTGTKQCSYLHASLSCSVISAL